MVQLTSDDLKRSLDMVRRPLALTRMGMIAEVAVRSLWPLMAVTLLALSALMLGAHEVLPVEGIWASVGVTVAAGLWSLVYALRRWFWPSRRDAILRLDGSLAVDGIAG